jgi:hypothetical protein
MWVASSPQNRQNAADWAAAGNVTDDHGRLWACLVDPAHE